MNREKVEIQLSRAIYYVAKVVAESELDSPRVKAEARSSLSAAIEYIEYAYEVLSTAEEN